MKTSRITDDMFARIPALLLEGTTKAEIAAMYGVTPGTLAVKCCRRGISLRKGGALRKRTKLPKRTYLTLQLSDQRVPLTASGADRFSHVGVIGNGGRPPAEHQSTR